MRLTGIGLAAALELSTTAAFAQGAGGVTTSSSIGGTATGTALGAPPASNPSFNAGGAGAGANSNLNPSGNSLISPSPQRIDAAACSRLGTMMS